MLPRLVLVSAVVELQINFSQMTKEEILLLSFTFGLQSFSLTLVFILKERRKLSFLVSPSYPFHEMKSKLCVRFCCMNKTVHKLLSSTRCLSHSFSPRLSILIRFYVTTYLLILAQKPENPRQVKRILSKLHLYSVPWFQYKDKKTLEWSILHHSPSSTLLVQKSGMFYNFKYHFRTQEHILSVIFPHLVYTFMDSFCTCLWSFIMPWC